MKSNNDLNSKILKLYENSSFFKVYGGDFWITVIFIIVCLLLTAFIFITNHFNKVRQNWKNERCNPLYMPFAGYINPDNGKGNLEYVNENFKFCNNKFIKKLETDAMQPIYGMTNNMNNMLNTLLNGWKAMMGIMNMLKTFLGNIAEVVISKVVAVLVAVQTIFIKVKDSVGKMNGTLVAMIYTFYNLYKVIKLYLLNIINIVIAEVLVSTILSLVMSIGLLIALIITYIVLMSVAGGLWPIPFCIGCPPAGALTGSAMGLLYGTIIPLTLTIAVMLIFDILIWIILIILHNFSKQIFKDINAKPIPKRTTKIKSSDIKTTSDDSTNPLSSNQPDSQ